MLSIGFGSVGLYDKRYQRSVLQLDGNIKLYGNSKVSLGHGSRISVGKNGCVTFGKNFINTAHMNICCVDSIVFGDDVVTSWETLVMDTDWHSVRNTKNNEVGCCTKPIVIGSGVWLCTKSMGPLGYRYRCTTTTRLRQSAQRATPSQPAHRLPRHF